jgi:hypothetical protein
MLDIDLMQTSLERSDLRRKLVVRASEGFEFRIVRVLYSTDVLPFFSELILRVVTGISEGIRGGEDGRA